ncbi:soluble quino protein glucose dehydrogenase [Thozetella sp. PMI_491]|nr:soluble quino protein glucose dehydrogenase [Thozetella sp. PMI_491]
MLSLRNIAAISSALVGFGGPSVVPFPANCSSFSASKYGAVSSVADGWKVAKIVGNLTQPRTVIFDPLGQMLVLQATKGVSVHTFGPDGCINSTKWVINGVGLNHGLSLTPDGKTMYVSSEQNVWQWTYDAAAHTASGQKTVVKAMSTGIHSTRTLYVVPNKPNIILVAVGSNSNFDYAAESPAAGRACVKAFDISNAPEGGYDYNTQGYQFGYGLRNEVALAFDPNFMVWGAENSGDDFTRSIGNSSIDIHTGNPAEEINYLGDPTKPNNNWYGYPTCFTVWDPSLITDTKFKTGDQFVVAPNATFSDVNCTKLSVPPRLALQAHSAPITAVFDPRGENLYITFHGSWDRQPATGYKVIQVPYKKLPDGRYDPVAPPDSMNGWNDILWTNDVGSCQSQTLTRSSCWRLAALAWDPAGTRLFVSSDNQSEGELFVLAKK